MTAIWAVFIAAACGGHLDRNKFPSVLCFDKGGLGGCNGEDETPPSRISSEGGGNGRQNRTKSPLAHV
jgi:hypothetical protein